MIKEKKKTETKVLESARETQELNAEQMIAAVGTSRQHGCLRCPGWTWLVSHQEEIGANPRQWEGIADSKAPAWE